jgi:nickel transport protein
VSRWVRAAAAVLGLALAAPAAAHETLHELRRGAAVAVKAYYVDGELLAYAPYEVYSPADPKVPWQKGRTDRGGWLAFVPEVPGKWRVRVIDDTGHGLDLAVDADAGSPAKPRATGGEAVSGAAFVLRPIAGLLVIGGVFAVLFRTWRRKESTR